MPDHNYNVYYPSNSYAPAEVNGLYTDPLLHATLYCVTNITSAVVTSGVPVSGFATDFYGNWRNPTSPCRGAIEVVISDPSGEDTRDGGGRLVSRAIQGLQQTFDYDGRNRLTSWNWSAATSNSAVYAYDHAGRRVKTTVVAGSTTNTTRYIYDGTDVATEYIDTNGDGTVDRTRVYWLLPGMDQRIGFVDIVSGTPQFYYYLTDQVGTVLHITDSAGNIVNQYDYDAWGNVRWGSTNTFETVENRYLFQGREYDRNGGFYYFRNRIYLPDRGEFASPDMNLNRGILGEMDGIGTLTFGGGDPVDCTDPLGLDWKDQYEWHHTLGQSVFAGDKPYTGELGLQLDPSIDPNSKEFGRIMRAPPHRGEGAPHLKYDTELKAKVKLFADQNPGVKVLTKNHIDQILDSLDPEFKTYNNQGLPSRISYSEWKDAVNKRLKNRYIRIRLTSGETITQPIKRGRLFGALQAAESLLRRAASAVAIVLMPLEVLDQQLDATEYREALILQHKVRGEDDATIEQRLKIRMLMEPYATPDMSPTPFANPLFDDKVEEYLRSLPEDEIGPTELPPELQRRIREPTSA